jgi:uncharacterized protein
MSVVTLSVLTMDQRISLITLGVDDLARARAFYDALGWVAPARPDDDVVFYPLRNGLVLALWSRSELASDSAVTDSGGWGGITLAINVESPAAVDGVLAQASAAGGRLGRAGAPTFWGGYSGIFLDPEGHPWEVAHNPSWTLTEDGRTLLGS